MEKLLYPFRQGPKLNALFLSNIFLSFHYYLVVYINSSFLNNFFSETQISALYVIGALVNTILLLNIPKLLNRIGNYTITIYMIAFEMVAILGMIFGTTHFLIGFSFILHQICVSIILFNLDVFLENVSTDETKTGEIRGTYLTLSNATLVIAPLIISVLVTKNHFVLVYLVAFLFLLPLYYYIHKYFKTFKDKVLMHIQIRETITEFFKSKNLQNIFISHFLLQLFYAFMIVYTPLYLQKYIGFSWSETGLIFTIMLLPFVLFELPVGNIADQKYGEKEFLTIGLIVMGLSTIFISFVTVKSFWIWTTILFITRIGASFVEITTDSFFFKHVSDSQTNLISFYRMSRPLSFVIAPIIATLALQFISFQYIFMIIGILVVCGIKSSIALSDSK